MEIRAFDVARYFCSLADVDGGDRMTHLKLQKLTFYAQAWHLALYNEPLFDGHFEAWKNGPVQPELYHAFKMYGRETIPPSPYLGVLTPRQQLVLNAVWDHYGKYEGKYLEELTHQELPWLEARDGLQDGEPCTNVIEEKTMAEYYRRRNSAVIKLSLQDKECYASKLRHRMTDEKRAAWREVFGLLQKVIQEEENGSL